MQDIFYIVIAVLFFVVAAAYVIGCDRLTGEIK
jgi:hypothetical protein